MGGSAQSIWDKIALLSLLDQTNKFGQIEGNLKLQKLVFLSELGGLEEPLVPMYFRFFRYALGPYSAELANEIKGLESGAFITSTSRRLTQRGHYILEYAADAIQNSQEARRAMEIIRDVAKRYGRRSGDELKAFVYKLKVPVYDLGGTTFRVKDVPHFLDILNPRHMKGADEVRLLDEQLIQDLTEEFALSPRDLAATSTSHRQIVSSEFRRIIQEHRPTS